MLGSIAVLRMRHIEQRTRLLRAAALAAAIAFLIGAGVALAEEAPQAYIMKVGSGISEALATAVERNIRRAEEEGVKTFILELNTPGGTIDASTQLADFIFTREDIDVIAYIHTQAYSGGTMLALACKEIYIDAKVGRMGAVAPVIATGEIMGEKQQTVVRETLRGYAAARGYPEALAQAMVSPSIEVWRLEIFDDPEPHYVTGVKYDAMPDEERERVVRRELIVPAGDLLTMTADKAIEYGFAKQGVGSTQALFDVLNLERKGVQRIYLTGSEKLLAFLDLFSPMLIVAGIVLLFMELNHPGFGLPGLLGLGCFVAFFLIKWTLHYARLLEFVLLLAGLALLLIEVFIIPGFGVTGVTGIALIFVSLVLMFQEFGLPETSGETVAFQYNLLKVTGALAVSVVLIGVLLRLLPSMPLLRRIVLQESLAAAHVGDMMEPHAPGLARMVGEVGLALTALRPAGRADFADTTLDVVTEGDFIEKGARVQIRQVTGNRVVVAEYREA